MRNRLPVNESLSESNPIPDDLTVLRAVAALEAEDDERTYSRGGASAADVAWKLGLRGMQRLGNGAVTGSWTGTMSPSLRIAPRLRSLKKRGLLDYGYDLLAHRTILVYRLTKAGREAIREEPS